MSVFVLATQNPLEMEGTYPPEAQLDRFFFKCMVPFPSRDQLVEISRRTTGTSVEVPLERIIDGEKIRKLQALVAEVPVAEPLVAYAASLILATHPDNDQAPEAVKRYASYGSSPRGMQTLIRGARVRAILAGRTAVSVADIKSSRSCNPATPDYSQLRR